VALAETIGRDGQAFLALVEAAASPAWLRRVAGHCGAAPGVGAAVHRDRHGPALAEDAALPSAVALIQSPYDPEAHYSKKRETAWVGLQGPSDRELRCGPSARRHAGDHHPGAHPRWHPDGAHHGGPGNASAASRATGVDPGFVDGAQVDTAQRVYGLDLLGPMPADTSWQTKAGAGFGSSDFHLDWDAQDRPLSPGLTRVGVRRGLLVVG